MQKISYQLYSSRNFPTLTDTLNMVADAGYDQVEGFGALYASDDTVESLKAGLAETGLEMPTGHFGLDFLQDDPQRAIAAAKALGLNAIIVPHIVDQDRDAAGWAAFGQELFEAGKPVLDAGLKFGWHNHAFEFNDLGGEDKPLDLILGASDDMCFEFDVAWAVVGGEDPLTWIDRYSDRLFAAHVKDIAPKGECVDEDGWADVGHGTMDWAAILAALKAAGTEVFVAEHDNPSDDKRFATRSLDSTRRLFGEIA